jgi:hypothetical protein
MTTATNQAPTKAEIRAALNARTNDWPSDDPLNQMREAIEGWASVLTGPAYDALQSPDSQEPGTPWTACGLMSAPPCINRQQTVTCRS